MEANPLRGLRLFNTFEKFYSKILSNKTDDKGHKP